MPTQKSLLTKSQPVSNVSPRTPRRRHGQAARSSMDARSQAKFCELVAAGASIPKAAEALGCTSQSATTSEASTPTSLRRGRRCRSARPISPRTPSRSWCTRRKTWARSSSRSRTSGPGSGKIGTTFSLSLNRRISTSPLSSPHSSRLVGAARGIERELGHSARSLRVACYNRRAPRSR